MQTVQIQDLGKRRVLRESRGGEMRFKWLRDGRLGTLDTVEDLAEFVRVDAVLDLGLQLLAFEILRDAGLNSHDAPEKVLNAISAFIKQHVIYLKDANAKLEAIGDARNVLSNGFGDCDDFAVLTATLCSLLGFKPRFVLTRYTQSNTNGFEHIYVEVDTPQGKVSLDNTLLKKPYNYEYPHFIERRTFEIFTNEIQSFDLEGIGSFFGKAFKGVGKGLKKTGKLALKAAPIAASFIPVVGQFASMGVEAAQGAYDAKKKGKASKTEFANEANNALDALLPQLSGGATPDTIDAQADNIVTQVKSSFTDKKGKISKGDEPLVKSVEQKAAFVKAASSAKRQEILTTGGNPKASAAKSNGNTSGGINVGGVSVNQNVLIFGGLGVGALLLLSRR